MYTVLILQGKKSKGGRSPPGKHQSNEHNKVKVTALAISSESKTVKSQRKCGCCSGTCPNIGLCDFKTMSITDRYKLVRKLKSCFNCLKGKHVSKHCRKPQACTVPDCKQMHQMLLHRWMNKSDHADTQPSVSCAVTNSSPKNCLRIIPVVVKGGNDNPCVTYALLDDGADKTLCDECLLDALNVDSKTLRAALLMDRRSIYKFSTWTATTELISVTYGRWRDSQFQPVQQW